MDNPEIPWIKASTLDWSGSSKAYLLTVELSIYSLEAVLKTCYLFLDQCYLFVEYGSSPGELNIYFTPQGTDQDIEQIIGEFSNRLLWQEVRRQVSDETKEIRERIVRQAFTEANLSGELLTEGDYNADPARIAE
jgi:His-Xaa-Ser system protein HxsD